MVKEKKETVGNANPEDLSPLPTENVIAGPIPQSANPNPSASLSPKPTETPEVKMVQISQDAWNQVQEKLKMLTEVADKGRVFNYESNQPQKKTMKVKVSLFNGGVIVGWRTLKDELIKHPTSGLTIGEKQEYEIKTVNSDGVESVVIVDGYPQFSNARYNERVDADVIAKKEDWQGNFDFDVRLQDGRVITLNSRFVN